MQATLFDTLKEIVNNLQELFDQNVTEILLCDSPNLKGNQNWQILLSILNGLLRILWIQRDLPVLCFNVGLLLSFLIMTMT